jgi:hypothetical protein
MESGIAYSEQELEIPTSKIEFYIVSPEKFLLLFIGTMGIYSIYWFYKHWSQYNKSTQERLWPIMRALFSIFFVHSLFENFEHRYKLQTGKYPVSINYLATIIVVITIVATVADILANLKIGTPYTEYFSFLYIAIICWATYKAQVFANKSGPDVNGQSNNKLTFLNYFWLLLGLIFWLLFLLGLLVIILAGDPVVQ